MPGAGAHSGYQPGGAGHRRRADRRGAVASRPRSAGGRCRSSSSSSTPRCSFSSPGRQRRGRNSGVPNANAPGRGAALLAAGWHPAGDRAGGGAGRGLSVEQIAARLDDRFRLLTGGGRTTLPRQQTLRAAVDWSWGLLGDTERVLFRRLASSPAAGRWRRRKRFARMTKERSTKRACKKPTLLNCSRVW